MDLANTKWGTIEATQPFRWQDAPSRAKRILRPGDTIIGMVRPGNGSFAFVSDSGLTGSTGFTVLRPRQSRYRELVFFSATAPENIERLANLADGAAYPAVRPEVVGGTEVAFCEDTVATSFSALVSPILDRMESNKKENHTLAQTRDLLLPRLMSGEIRLSEAEKAVEADGMKFSESHVEDAALEWLSGLGYTVLHGPAHLPGWPHARTHQLRPGAADPAIA